MIMKGDHGLPPYEGMTNWGRGTGSKKRRFSLLEKDHLQGGRAEGLVSWGGKNGLEGRPGGLRGRELAFNPANRTEKGLRGNIRIDVIYPYKKEDLFEFSYE